MARLGLVRFAWGEVSLASCLRNFALREVYSYFHRCLLCSWTCFVCGHTLRLGEKASSPNGWFSLAVVDLSDCLFGNEPKPLASSGCEAFPVDRRKKVRVPEFTVRAPTFSIVESTVYRILSLIFLT